MTPDIGPAAIQYDRVLAAGLARRVGAGQQSLGRGLFIAGGPVDLACEEEPWNPLALQAVDQLARVDMVILDGIAPAQDR